MLTWFIICSRTGQYWGQYFFLLFKQDNIDIFDRTQNKDFFPMGFPHLCLLLLLSVSSGCLSLGKYGCKIILAVQQSDRNNTPQPLWRLTTKQPVQGSFLAFHYHCGVGKSKSKPFSWAQIRTSHSKSILILILSLPKNWESGINTNLTQLTECSGDVRCYLITP